MVIRVQKNTDYTVMANFHLRDSNLSLKAKGLLSYMLSLPDDWDYSVSGLTKICKESTKCINNILKELEINNYLERRRIYENGKISRWEYLIHEKQHLQNEDIGNEDIQNELQINTNIQNTKKLNTNKQKEKYKKELFELFWSRYPKKVDKQKTIKWFEKNNPTEELVNKMIEKIEKFRQTKQWQNRQYIPNPTTWLNGKRWEDELDESDDCVYDVWEIVKRETEEKKNINDNR